MAGRRPNPLLAAARAAGEKFYEDAAPCGACGGFDRYTANGSCVSCARFRGSHRYALLDDDGLARQKAKDRDRYERRKRARDAAVHFAEPDPLGLDLP